MADEGESPSPKQEKMERRPEINWIMTPEGRYKRITANEAKQRKAKGIIDGRVDRFKASVDVVYRKKPSSDPAHMLAKENFIKKGGTVKGIEIDGEDGQRYLCVTVNDDYSYLPLHSVPDEEGKIETYLEFYKPVIVETRSTMNYVMWYGLYALLALLVGAGVVMGLEHNGIETGLVAKAYDMNNLPTGGAAPASSEPEEEPDDGVSGWGDDEKLPDDL